MQRWRARYFVALESAAPDRDNWTTVHSVYRNLLDSLLAEYNITDFSAAEREELTLSWQRLVPWPDVVPEISDYTMTLEDTSAAPLSNKMLTMVAEFENETYVAVVDVGTSEPDNPIYQRDMQAMLDGFVFLPSDSP